MDVCWDQLSPASPSSVFRNDHPLYVVVVDGHPRFGYEAMVFVETITELAGIPPERVHAHVLPEADPFIVRYLEKAGVLVTQIEPTFGGSYGNNLAMYSCSECRQADTVVRCDLDLAFTMPIEPLPSTIILAGRTVPTPNPPLSILARILGAADLPFPELNTALNGEMVFKGQFNGGFVIMSALGLVTMADDHPKWYEWLNHQPELLGSYRGMAMEVSRFLAIVESKVAPSVLTEDWNFHTEQKMDVLQAQVGALEGELPKVLHYHKLLDKDGLLRLRGLNRVDRAIGRVNDVIRAKVLNTSLGRYQAEESRQARGHWVEHPEPWLSSIVRNREHAQLQRLRQEAAETKGLQKEVARLRKRTRQRGPLVEDVSSKRLMFELARRTRRRLGSVTRRSS